jgi:hypothetical protein
MAANAPASGPNNSTAIRLEEMGVFAAPAKTPTKPMPASREVGSGRIPESALPSVEPMKNRGVTSPPLNPLPRVSAVNPNFAAKSYQCNRPPKDARIVGIPSPI